jgi:hypothetical protein
MSMPMGNPHDHRLGNVDWLTNDFDDLRRLLFDDNFRPLVVKRFAFVRGRGLDLSTWRGRQESGCRLPDNCFGSIC